MKSSTWIISTVSAAVSVLVLMCAVTYTYDPYCYYRITNNTLKSSTIRFVNPGIAKHAEYDTVIIGSSMAQNFNMDTFRKQMNLNPVKLTSGGMSIEERAIVLALVARAKKAHTYIFNIDIAPLNNNKSLESFPTYLYDASIFNDYNYLLGYEVWMRIMPVSMVTDILERYSIDTGRSYGGSVDRIGEWKHQYAFGADILIKNWHNQKQQVSEQTLNGMKERMTANADILVGDIVRQCGDKQVIIFFPPYSALYWYGAEQKGYYDTFNDIKKHIVSTVDSLDNVIVYDFQCMPVIIDLDNYKDTTHYSADINELMVACMAEKKYVVTTNNIDDSIRKLDDLLAIFTRDNIAWLIN